MGHAAREALGPSRSRIGNYVFVFGTEVAVALGALICVRLVANASGRTGIAAYSIGRRLVSLALPVVTIGMAVGLPRFLALQTDPQAALEYAGTAAAVLIASSAAWLLFFTALQGPLGAALFGSAAYGHLIIAVALTLVACVAHVFCYNLFRGLLRFRTASVLQAFNLALVPALAFALSPTVSGGFVAFAAGILLGCGVALAFTAPSIAIGLRRERASDLIRFGAQRLFAELGLMTLLALPPVVFTHTQGLEGASDVSLGMMGVTLMGSAFSPIGMILLPEAAQRLARRQHAELTRQIRRLLWIVLPLSIGSCVAFIVLCPQLMRLYLGAGHHTQIDVVRRMVLAAPAYAVFLCLAGVIDAFYARPVNSRNVIGVLVVYVVALGLCHVTGSLAERVTWVSVGAFWLLGAITLIQLFTVLRHLRVST